MAKEESQKKKKRPTAQKRMIQNKKRNLQNRMFKSRVNTTMRALKEAIKSGEQTLIKEKLAKAFSMMDKGVKKGLYKKNKAARTKSRLSTAAK